MKSKAVVSAILALSLTTAGFSFAQGNSQRNDRGRNENVQQDQRGEGNRNDRGRNENDRQERGAGRNHSYHRGDRLPASEHRKQYVVNDWRGHNLRAPPRGYHWVQSGNDFVLAAIATGIIAEIFLRN